MSRIKHLDDQIFILQLQGTSTKLRKEVCVIKIFLSIKFLCRAKDTEFIYPDQKIGRAILVRSYCLVA